MKFKKKLEKIKIVVPTAYIGSAEPKEPKEGDIWQNQHTNELCVYLGNKWFKVWNVEETGYTEQEETEITEVAYDGNGGKMYGIKDSLNYHYDNEFE